MIPNVVIDTFGIGPASTLRAPMKVIDVAMNAGAIARSGRAVTEPVGGGGVATQATTPGITAGR